MGATDCEMHAASLQEAFGCLDSQPANARSHLHMKMPRSKTLCVPLEALTVRTRWSAVCFLMCSLARMLLAPILKCESDNPVAPANLVRCMEAARMMVSHSCPRRQVATARITRETEAEGTTMAAADWPSSDHSATGPQAHAAGVSPTLCLFGSCRGHMVQNT